MAYRKDLPTYNEGDFLKTHIYTSLTAKAKDLLLDLLNKVRNAGIDCLIKVRGDALALVPSTNKDNNIITIWARKEYLIILVLNVSKKAYCTKDDINNSLLQEMQRVYENNK